MQHNLQKLEPISVRHFVYVVTMTRSDRWEEVPYPVDTDNEIEAARKALIESSMGDDFLPVYRVSSIGDACISVRTDLRLWVSDKAMLSYIGKNGMIPPVMSAWS